MTISVPFSIRIFVADGDPDGLRVIERSNWNGRALVFPRSLLPDIKKREEFDRTGVYLLLGPQEEGDGEMLYVGEGDPVRPRLETHYSKKDFWNRCVFFVTGQQGALNKAHVQYLEARLVELALAAKRMPLDNQNTPNRPTLNEADQADMEVFLSNLLQILPLLGISAFETPSATRPSKKKRLFIEAKGLKAEGYESTEGFVVCAKLEEGDAYCVVGVVGYPGFPSITPKKLGVGDDLMKGFFFPLHMIIAARIEKFERAGRSITIVFRPRRSAFQNIFDALMAANVIGIGTQQIYLIEGAPYDNSKIVVEILKQIGNPAIATPSKEALQAMGKAAPKKILKGTDPDSPVARVLWDAKNLANQAYRSNADAKAIADFAKTANETELNQSQVDAVENVAARSLSIVWGPPGTGKTNTLTAFLHAVIRECKQKRILITGPNYRTVEELAERLAKNLGADTTSQCSFFWVYSRGRDPKPTPAVGGHLDLRSIRLEAGTEEVDHMRTQAADSNRTVVVATTAHMVDQVVQCVGGTWKKMDEVFDLVVLDESSQMPVDLAIRPLCGLKFGGQIVIAGDHLQMPPIQALEPPAGAEYLVSSIQTYLIERFSVPRQELLVNYRSNTDFVEYAKTLGYPQNLVAHSPNRQLLVLNPIAATVAALPAHLPKSDAYEDLLDPGKRVSSLIHDDPVSSQANATEAGLVGALALCLRQAMAKELDDGSGAVGTPLDDDFFFEKALGIVTPHKAQKALVVRELFKVFPKANPTKVYESVDTVERFQGGERQTIIVSFGVGDTDVIEGEEAFLLQMERTNVAVSRAMAKCIVIMPESLAYHLPGDQKAAEASIAIKSYIEEFCHKRRSASIQFNGETRQAEIRWR